MFSSIATITSEAWTNQSPKNVNTYLHTYLLSSKTMRGPLFPLLPLRVKCQNHEKAPISPISPILVVHVLSSCHDTGHQNREIGTLSLVLALDPGKTLRGSLFHLFPLRVKCQNHERVPISFISSISSILLVHVYSSCQDMDHQNRGNKGNRDPLMVLALHPGKTLKGSLFHLFWWPMSWQDDKNRGNRDPLIGFGTSPREKRWEGPYFTYFP